MNVIESSDQHRMFSVWFCDKCGELQKEIRPDRAHMVPSCFDKKGYFDDFQAALCQKCHLILEEHQRQLFARGASFFEILRFSVAWLKLDLLVKKHEL